MTVTVDPEMVAGPETTEYVIAPDEFEVTETVKTAGRSLLNYVSRRLTAKSGVTMRVLCDVRIA